MAEPAADGPADVDANDLAACLRVLEQVSSLDPDHPDAHTVRRATAALYKSYKVRRRTAKRIAIADADKAVVASTATGAAGRHRRRDAAASRWCPTHLVPLAGVLQRSRPCYICKTHYTEVDAFYHQLCPACARINREQARCESRPERTSALLTGGRAKIGMYIALRLLRDGAHTTITTRFPRDAVRRFAAMDDSGDWLHRLRIVGIDLRDPAQVVALADEVAAAGPLDILINNAAQTVRRSPGSYAALVAAESGRCRPVPCPTSSRSAAPAARIPHALAGELETGTLTGDPAAHLVPLDGPRRHRAGAEGALGPRGRRNGDGRARPRHRRRRPGPRPGAREQLDAGGARGRPARAARGPAVQHDRAVHPRLRLRPSMAAVDRPPHLCRERLGDGGPVHPQLQGPRPPAHQHGQGRTEHADPHQRAEMFDRRHPDDRRRHRLDHRRATAPHQGPAAEEGFHAPLDLVDGAARVYDPIVRGERVEDLYGCFLKDFEPSAW